MSWFSNLFGGGDKSTTVTTPTDVTSEVNATTNVQIVQDFDLSPLSDVLDQQGDSARAGLKKVGITVFGFTALALILRTIPDG